MKKIGIEEMIRFNKILAFLSMSGRIIKKIDLIYLLKNIVNVLLNQKKEKVVSGEKKNNLV